MTEAPLTWDEIAAMMKDVQKDESVPTQFLVEAKIMELRMKARNKEVQND